MQILATTYGGRAAAALIKIQSGEITWIEARPEFFDNKNIFDNVACRPFGITWNHDELYIANNRQLLVYDRSLRYMRTEQIPLPQNVHQLASYGGHVWAVSPFTNSLIGVRPGQPISDWVEFDLLDVCTRAYTGRDGQRADDRAHFNSLLWTDSCLYVAAHNCGRPSFIVTYDTKTLSVRSIRPNCGQLIHGLALDGDELFWLSTGTAEIRSSAGRVIPLVQERFARGLAVTKDVFVVGFTKWRDRSDRFNEDAWIQLIDRQSGSAQSEIVLPDSGNINDLRLLDAIDFAHLVEPFWAAGSENSRQGSIL